MAGDVLYTVAASLGGNGIGRIAYHEAMGLARAGRLARIVALGADRDVPAPVACARFVPRGALPFLSDRAFYRLRNRRFDRLVSRRVGDAARLHAWTAQCPRAVARAKALGKRVVLHRASTHVDTQTEWLAAEYARWDIAPVLPYPSLIARCREEYGHADRIVVPSELARRSFVDRGVPAGKLVVNPFGVDGDEFRPVDRRGRRGARLLFVGEIGVRKGAPRLFRMFERLGVPGVAIDLVGPVKPEVARLAAAFRDRRDVAFHGFQPDIRPYLDRADLFVFPTVEDGFGLVVTEAMAAGLPVVVSDRAGAAEVVGDGGAVVALDDEDGWIATVRDLLADTDRRHEVGLRARAAVRPLTWEAFGDRAAAVHADLDGEEGR
jgi:glycosyltransferase involved in cell wall biosynthesis